MRHPQRAIDYMWHWRLEDSHDVATSSYAVPVTTVYFTQNTLTIPCDTITLLYKHIQHYAVHISIVEVSWNTHVPVPAVHCTYQLLCTSTLYTLLTMPVHCTSTLNLYTVPIHCASGPVHVYCAGTMYAVPIPVEPLYS